MTAVVRIWLLAALAVGGVAGGVAVLGSPSAALVVVGSVGVLGLAVGAGAVLRALTLADRVAVLAEVCVAQGTPIPADELMAIVEAVGGGQSRADERIRRWAQYRREAEQRAVSE